MGESEGLGPKFRTTQCNDVGFAIVFLLQVAGMLAWIGHSFTHDKYSGMTHASQTALLLFRQPAAPEIVSPAEALPYAAMITLVGLLAAVALAILYMVLLQLFPVEMVWLSLISCPVIMFLLSGGCLIGGNFGEPWALALQVLHLLRLFTVSEIALSGPPNFLSQYRSSSQRRARFSQ